MVPVSVELPRLVLSVSCPTTWTPLKEEAPGSMNMMSEFCTKTPSLEAKCSVFPSLQNSPERDCPTRQSGWLLQALAMPPWEKMGELPAISGAVQLGSLGSALGLWVEVPPSPAQTPFFLLGTVLLLFPAWLCLLCTVLISFVHREGKRPTLRKTQGSSWHLHFRQRLPLAAS